ncbi:N-acetyltransferase [Staphylococcus chromogenes]|uniref:GNAT family N-acetyltransferase n=1 Tax=Staphylococcus chromogenes TaxID=46126 RepID=UPI000D1A1C41|nr:GNAT family N-acetyltransferase [Staphylococcus chromogenes]PTG09706.1 N-acetyltransferase [Staphylococcus chromogenes]PTG11692.1 N-acetyltransferase [Staphylococcus chromogenes]
MIREAKTQDLKAITEIYNDAIRNTTAVYTYLETTVEERTQWMMKKQNEGWPLWVYEIEDNIAGFATYGTFRDWPAYQYTIEHSIYVSTQYRRKRVASKLLVHLIEDAKKKGYQTIIAGIDASNNGSILLHERHGFVAAGVLHQVGYKFDRWLDLAFYQLQLK